ncbi:MAG TPA: sugar transferase [Candidatus Paceibacterota bacterium]|nr:sugar transferase [Candidatus Pacearchaeota archaeon]HRZ50669.1 sugar transferase [Candidatus Paceibacterota bacterium]HSA36434.1 sugar transferase [Candidatus Paceibacterota bacterium]
MEEWLGKRQFDFICSLFGLAVLSPVFLIAALAVKFDSKGPVFFRQERAGKGGKNFLIYKLRTMVKDAPRLGQHFTTQTGDSRITRSGAFLRKYNIDELPQLINVLKGEMSLVGPRPEVPEIVKLYTKEQRKVLTVRPGLTDYASLEFRREGEILAGSADLYGDYVNKVLPKKIELQLKYIKKQSLITDLELIFLTVSNILGF